MKNDCRNDCLDPLRFPRKIENRPALPHIDYRLGTYSDIREALLRNLDKTPNLSRWTHRGSDDPGIALLEGASILGDILTFYQELYANEAYLRTAQQRNSIADLVRLLGYHLSPGLGGNAIFAFEIKGTAPVVVPAHFPLKAQLADHEQPSNFETSAEFTAYPWLNKFNLYRRLYTPNISNQSQELYIFEPDQFVSPTELKPGDRLLVGDSDNPANPTRMSNTEIVIIDSVRQLHGRKLYKIKGALKLRPAPGVFELTAFKLGRSFHHFGNNGARKITKPPASISVTATTTPGPGGSSTINSTTTTVIEYPHSFDRSLTDTTTTLGPYSSFRYGPNSIKYCDPSLAALEFALDSAVEDLAAGARLVIDLPLYKDGSSPALNATLVRTINSIRSASQTFGVVTGNSTIVTLDQQLAVTAGGYLYWFTDTRPMLFQEVIGPPLRVRGGQQEIDSVSGNELYFFGTEAQAQTLATRRLLFVKPGSVPRLAKVTTVPTLAPAVANRPLLRAITLDHDLTLADFPNESAIVTVYGNLADATEGKKESAAPLGNGDNRLVFQTFKLPKAPLTYLISESATPPEVPELQIYVNKRLWQQVPSFFGRKPHEEIYLVREDDENNSWVQFGDGKTGARLPSGIKNVVAMYRTGTGAFGPLKANAKAQAGSRLDGLDKIQMPAAASGGSAREDGENARQAAPGKIQSLDRLVSLADFESEAIAMAGVIKAAAAWRLVNNIPEVVLTVLLDTGRATEIVKVRETIAGYNRGRGPDRFPIDVLAGQRKYVILNATYGYDATFLKENVERAIRIALGASSGKSNSSDDQSGLFSLRRRAFGQREYASSIAGIIQNAAGVLWAQVTCFDALGLSDNPSALAVPPTPVMHPAVDCESGNVLSLYTGHLQLTGVSEVVREVN